MIGNVGQNLKSFLRMGKITKILNDATIAVQIVN